MVPPAVGGEAGPRLAWPWAAAALCSVALAVPSLLALPARLAVERAAAEPTAAEAGRSPARQDQPALVVGEDDGLVTGTLASSSAPSVETTVSQFGIRLAGGESADLLWTHWSEIRARFPGLLDGLATTVKPVPSGDDRPRFELLAGRYRNAAEAAALCGRLRAHDIACAVRKHEDAAPGIRG